MRAALVVAIIVTSAAAPSFCQQASDLLRWGPILGVVTETSAAISWRTWDVIGGFVRYRATPAAGEATDWLIERSNAVDDLHHVQLFDLRPGETYEYQIVLRFDETELPGPIGNVTTPSQDMEEFTFLIWSDVHASAEGSVAAYVAEQMLNDPTDPLFFVTVGDFAHDPTEVSYDAYFNAIGDLARSTPHLAVPGNHETSRWGDEGNHYLYYDYLVLPSGIGIDNEECWATQYGDVLLIGLQTVAIQAEDGSWTLPEERLDFLDNTLETSDAAFKLVFGHIPVYSSYGMSFSGVHPLLEGHAGANPLYEPLLVPIYVKHGVDIVISGHNHSYEHFWREGVHYLTVGGGGSPFLGSRYFWPEGEIHVQANTYFYVRITVTGSSLMSETIAVAERADDEVLRYDSPITIDTFEITKPAGTASDSSSVGLHPITEPSANPEIDDHPEEQSFTQSLPPDGSLGTMIQGVEVIDDLAFAVDWQTGILYRIDTETGAYSEIDTALPGVTDLANDGKQLWLVSEEGVVKTYDLTSGTLTDRDLGVDVDGEVLGVAYERALYLLVYQGSGPRLLEISEDDTVDWFEIVSPNGIGEMIGLQCIGSDPAQDLVTLDYQNGILYRLDLRNESISLSWYANVHDYVAEDTVASSGVRGFFFGENGSFFTSAGLIGKLHTSRAMGTPLSWVEFDLSRIDWLASLNDDDTPADADNRAITVNGSDDDGRYFGMAWKSPMWTDLSLNGLGQFNHSDATTLSLTLAASETMNVEVWIGMNADYCGQTWRTAIVAHPLSVGTTPKKFFIPYTAFSKSPPGSCREPLPEDALENLTSIVLFPQASEGELHIYDAGVGDMPLDEAQALFELEEEAEYTLPVIAGLEAVGNPLRERYPDEEELALARSIWDLQAWQGRLYLGSGNSGNSGPAANAGPVDVWYYDPFADSFVNEFTVDDEQIDRYCVLSDSLYIPGHDARESWDSGNFYVNRGDGWIKTRTLPNAIHVYDIAEWEDKLVAVGHNLREVDDGGFYGGGGFYVSDDGGTTWVTDFTPCTHYSATVDYDPTRPDVVRVTELFELNGTLYASGWLMPRVYALLDGRFEYVDVNPFPGSAAPSGSSCADLPVTAGGFVTTTYEDTDWYAVVEANDPCVSARVTENVIFHEEFVYIGGTMGADHEWNSFGLFAATEMQNGEIRQLTLPDALEQLRDLLVVGDLVYLLAFTETEDGFRNRVYSTSDLANWNVILEFLAEASILSMEYLDGWLYVGLGGDSSASGNLYRFRM